jgi:hypothetical protein
MEPLVAIETKIGGKEDLSRNTSCLLNFRYHLGFNKDIRSRNPTTNRLSYWNNFGY